MGARHYGPCLTLVTQQTGGAGQAGFLRCVHEQAVENDQAIVWELTQLGYLTAAGQEVGPLMLRDTCRALSRTLFLSVSLAAAPASRGAA